MGGSIAIQVLLKRTCKLAFTLMSSTVLFYFAESPFYDRTSNNATLFTQGMNNAAMAQFLYTRQAFESRLREMQGLEFMVSHDPLLPPYSPYPIGVEPSNIWVIKK